MDKINIEIKEIGICKICGKAMIGIYNPLWDGKADNVFSDIVHKDFTEPCYKKNLIQRVKIFFIKRILKV